MIASGRRTIWVGAGLLALAAVLLALSFVPWGETTFDGAIQSVRPTPSPAVPTSTPAEVGRVLFGLKGCNICHHHDELPSESNLLGAPNLTHYQPDPEFVHRWLSDPRAIRRYTSMPNLNLSEDEIEALLAFLQTNTAE